MNDLQYRLSPTQLPQTKRHSWFVMLGFGFLGMGLCLVLTACQNITGVRTDDGTLLLKSSGPGLVANSQSLIPDVPTPVGFVGVPSRSTSYVAADGVRIVDHAYQGRASMADAVHFYRLHLPNNGWQRVREQSEARTTFMTFTKGRETLTMRITERGIVDVLASIRGSTQPTQQPAPQQTQQTTTANRTPSR